MSVKWGMSYIESMEEVKKNKKVLLFCNFHNNELLIVKNRRISLLLSTSAQRDATAQRSKLLGSGSCLL